MDALGWSCARHDRSYRSNRSSLLLCRPGFGALSMRAFSSRPVRLYGYLELGAATGALWSLAVFSVLAHDTAQVWLSAAGIAGRVAAVAVAILPTTFCLGATLPALGQALASVETVGRRGGLLYAVNTAGAVLGAAAAGFGLPLLVGVREATVSPPAPACWLDSSQSRSVIATSRCTRRNRKRISRIP